MLVDIVILTIGIALPVAALAYPYLWGMVLKARMLKRLREHARAEGYRYRRFYKNIFLVTNRGIGFDMIIYNDGYIYPVKLWSSYFTRTELLIKKDKIRERRETMAVFPTAKGERETGRHLNGMVHAVPKTRLARKYTKSPRKIIPVLLIYPSYKSIYVLEGKSKTAISSGDTLFGKTVYSPSAFTAELSAKGSSGDTKGAKGAEKFRKGTKKT